MATRVTPVSARQRRNHRFMDRLGKICPLRKLQWVVAWILRFIRNSCRSSTAQSKRKILKSIPELQDMNTSSTINAKEMKRALTLLVKTYQLQFSNMMKAPANRRRNVLWSEWSISLLWKSGKSRIAGNHKESYIHRAQHWFRQTHYPGSSWNNAPFNGAYHGWGPTETLDSTTATASQESHK